jgi:hypothetical protein
MKYSHRNPLLFMGLVVCCACLGFALSIYVGAQTPPCENPPKQSSTNGAAWRGEVSVVINSTDFPTQAERNAIQAAFQSHQGANGPAGSNSGVTFTFTTGTQPAPSQGRQKLITFALRHGNAQEAVAEVVGFQRLSNNDFSLPRPVD